ncbi:hypothetical protein TSAR_008777, partial [Trichomalopsis sarcophagae]
MDIYATKTRAGESAGSLFFSSNEAQELKNFAPSRRRLYIYTAC